MARLRKQELVLLLSATRDALKEANKQRQTPKKRLEVERLALIIRLAEELQRRI